MYLKQQTSHYIYFTRCYQQCDATYMCSPDPTNVQQRETRFLLVFENKLDVLVGEGHQVGADQGHHGVQDRRLDKVHVPDPPKQPWKDESQSLLVITVNMQYVYIYIQLTPLSKATLGFSMLPKDTG